jgi:hypothetical protein
VTLKSFFARTDVMDQKVKNPKRVGGLEKDKPSFL